MKFCNLLVTGAPVKFKIPSWLKKEEIKTLIDGVNDEEEEEDSGASGFSLIQQQ